jgi:glycosyltransferase involved in cell wall biosynthesis
MTRHLAMLFADHCAERGVAHTMLSLARSMHCAHMHVSTVVPTADPDITAPGLATAAPAWLPKLPYRLAGRCYRQAAERAYLQRLQPGDLAYLWSSVSDACIDALVGRGVRIVREKFSLHTAVARAIRDDAYAALGLPPARPLISDAMIRQEHRLLELADCVVSPSPGVTQSLRDQHVPAEKILSSSYGWSPKRFSQVPPTTPANRKPVVLYVGLVGIMKGVHHLLDAWCRAEIDGTLVLCGPVEPALADARADALARDDVEVLGDCADVAPVYRRADFFAFPSLAEGSPLVSYEALAHGLPVIASSMGAGDVIREGEEGFIHEPTAIEAWIDSMQRLASDVELRHEMSNKARARAALFTWERVGRQRREAICNRFPAADAARRAAA